MSQLDECASYTIRVQGGVDQALLDWFGPVRMTTTQAADGQRATTLIATLADQAAMVGFVRHLHALGVVLLAIERNANAEPTGVSQ